MDQNEIIEKLRQEYLQNYPFFRHSICKYKDFQEFHVQLDKCLLSPTRYKLIMIPRNHLKSSAVMSWIAHKIINNPDISVLYESSVYIQAKKYLGEIKNIIESKEFISFFGDIKGTPWTDSSIQVNNRKKTQPAPTVSASGLDKTQTGQHYDLIILDDLVDELNSKTEDGRMKAINRYRQALSLMRPGGTIVLIGTPWDREDLYGWILKQPAIRQMFEVVKMDVYDSAGRILFHQKFCEKMDDERENPGKRSLEGLRLTLGAYQFSCQYRVNPDAEEFSEFKTSWIRRASIEVCEERLHRYRGRVGIFCDPALGKENTKNPCDTAIVIVHFMDNRTADILEEDVGRCDPGATVEKLFYYATKYASSGETGVYIEDVGFQSVLAKLVEERRKDSPFWFSVTAAPPRGDKDARIRGVFAYYKFGQITHSQAISAGKVEKQLERFPKDRLKDSIDALSMFTQHVDFPLKKIEEKINFPAKDAFVSLRAPRVTARKEASNVNYLMKPGSSDTLYKIGE